MKKLYFFSLIILSFSFTRAKAQMGKILSDCTIEYELSVDDSNADVAKSMKGATKTVYIKGNQSRSDLVSPSYVLTVLHNSKSDTTIVLKEIGATKYLSYITAQKRAERNRAFDGITFTPTNETKIILGYDCKKVIAKLKDGSTFNVFYTTNIVPSNKEYEYEFRDLPGFVLEYETQADDRKNKIRYSATKISQSPVPASKFDIPKSGYRVL